MLFVTTNKHKVDRANAELEKYGISVVHKAFEMQEMQISNGEQIVRCKAQQAFERFQQPLLVNDDFWKITALRGFPGVNMKQCNDYLVGEDWLRLMQGIENREVIKEMYYCVVDQQGKMTTVVGQHTYEMLQEVRGVCMRGPVLTVIAQPGSTTSIAEDMKNNLWNEQKDDLYERLAKAIQDSTTNE